MSPELKRYYSSPKWANLRIQVFRRDNYQCQRCFGTKTLQAHHLTYEHVFNEPLEDLVTLCANDHAWIDKTYRWYRRTRWLWPNRFISRRQWTWKSIRRYRLSRFGFSVMRAR